MGPIRIGLVGAGMIARSRHIPTLANDHTFRLEACADKVATIEGLANFASLDDMLAALPGLDAVAICTPPQTHFDLARAALMRGKHVLLEKPPCVTLGQLDYLAALAEQSHVTLFQSWHSRHAAAVGAVRAMLLERRVGGIRIVWKEDVRQWHPGQKWIWQTGGFGVFDPAINALSILTEIVPAALFVREARLQIPENCATPIAADLDLVTAAGGQISAAFDFRYPGTPTWDIDIETDSGALKLANGGSRLFVDGEPVALSGAEEEYPSLYRHFAGLVTRGVSDVDSRPFRLVADAFLIGTRTIVDRFDP